MLVVLNLCVLLMYLVFGFTIDALLLKQKSHRKTIVLRERPDEVVELLEGHVLHYGLVAVAVRLVIAIVEVEATVSVAVLYKVPVLFNVEILMIAHCLVVSYG